MKSLLLATLLLVTHAFTTAQERNVVLVMNHTLDGKPFTFNTPLVASTGGFYKITRLEYYVSGVQIVHDGGQILSLPDAYFLVNPSKGSPLALGSHSIQQIEAVRFKIGVDAARNHTDPATYSFTHPLAPKNPSMHWGWSAGYRFIALEGFAGTTAGMLTTNFQVHSVGDALYTPVQITTPNTVVENELVVTINAEYANALKNIDVAQGPTNHGSDGEALVLIQNFGSSVFSPGATSGVDAQNSSSVQSQPSVQLVAYPNPARDRIVIESTMRDNTPVVLRDMLGRIVGSTVLVAGRATMSLSSLPTGSYTAVAADEQIIQSVRVSVAP